MVTSSNSDTLYMLLIVQCRAALLFEPGNYAIKREYDPPKLPMKNTCTTDQSVTFEDQRDKTVDKVFSLYTANAVRSAASHMVL